MVSPKVRRIAAHHPTTPPLWEYYKQVFWSSGIDPQGFLCLADRGCDAGCVGSRRRKAGTVDVLPPEFIIVFEPATHSAHFIDFEGEPTDKRQQLRLTFNKAHPPKGSITLRPGPSRLALDNESSLRTLPTVFVADELHHLLAKRGRSSPPSGCCRTRCSAMCSRLNSTIDQRLDDLVDLSVHRPQGVDALYERVGDLAAFDLVRGIFHALLEIIAAEKGAVVKTIGDAVMATFVKPDHASSRACGSCRDGQAQCRARQVGPDRKDRNP